MVKLWPHLIDMDVTWHAACGGGGEGMLPKQSLLISKNQQELFIYGAGADTRAVERLGNCVVKDRSLGNTSPCHVLVIYISWVASYKISNRSKPSKCDGNL